MESESHEDTGNVDKGYKSFSQLHGTLWPEKQGVPIKGTACFLFISERVLESTPDRNRKCRRHCY